MTDGQMPGGQMESGNQDQDAPSTTEVNLQEMPSVPDGPESLGVVAGAKASGLSSDQWSSWQPRSGSSAIYAPAATSWGENRIDLFAIGLDSQVYHQWWDGKVWSDWESLKGTSISAPAAVSRGSNRLDVFAIGTDKQIYHKSWDGKVWSKWESLGGTGIHGVAATSWGANRIDLFTVGTDSSMYHKYWNGSAWSSWKIMRFKGQEDVEKSSTSISAPAAVSWGPNRIDIFTLGIDNYVYHAWGDGSSEWRGWEKLGGPCLHGVVAASRGANSLDLFSISTDTIGTDNHMYHRSWNGSSWSRWENLGGACISAPAAVSLGENRIDTFVIGTKSAIYQKYWTGGSGELGVSMNIKLSQDLSNTQQFMDALFDPEVRLPLQQQISEKENNLMTMLQESSEQENDLMVWLIADDDRKVIRDSLKSKMMASNLENPKDSDAILMQAMKQYIKKSQLALFVPNIKVIGKIVTEKRVSLTKKEKKVVYTYKLKNYKKVNLWEEEAEISQKNIELFLDLFLAGAHFVVIHSKSDLYGEKPDSFFDVIKQLPAQSTATGHSHYLPWGKLVWMHEGIAYPKTITKDVAPDNCPLVVSLLVDKTVKTSDHNSFFQLEGWPGIGLKILNSRHGADFKTHKTTKWNISTFGACPYSEKRGTSVFLAPENCEIKPDQQTIMYSYLGSYDQISKEEKRSKAWLERSLISLEEDDSLNLDENNE